MREIYLILFLFIGTSFLFAQSNPTAQSLPYSQNFSALAHSSTAFPDGWQGWQLATSPSSSFRTTAPTGDRSLIASSTASINTGNVHNYDGKIGFLNTGSLDLTVVLAINTIGKVNIEVDYDIMTIRNPYDGGSNTKINEVTLQYRVGTSGSFTNLAGIEYENNTTLQTGSGVTTPQDSQTKTITLPSACDNQTVIQLRWASREVSGGGARPSFAVDNISIDGDDIPIISLSLSSITGFSFIEGSGPSSEQSFTISGSNLTANISIVPPANYEISTGTSGSFVPTNPITLTQSGGTVNETTIYVRLKAGLTAGNYNNENITASSTDAANKTVTCNGSVTTNNVVIAEIYGGGGNSGAPYKYDYVILYNPTSSPIDLSTWSIQYAPATTGSFNQQQTLTGSIGVGEYYSIQLASNDTSIGVVLPFTPNVIGTINLAAVNGRVVLASKTTEISGLLDTDVIDFVGYGTAIEFEGSGAAPAPSNTTSIRRKDNSGNSTYGTNGNGWDTDQNSTDFYLETNLIDNPPLPVELTSFTAALVNNSVVLKWQTATEVNNYGFEIERASTENRDTPLQGWEAIGFVEGHGNSNAVKDYSFSDKSISAGAYSYRLQQIDTDGTFEYSEVVEIDITTPAEFSIAQNYPNPFNPVTTISYTLPVNSNVKLAVYNLLGEEVAMLVNSEQQAGVYNISFDAAGLASGTYIYRIIANYFVQTSKMVLMK